MEPITREEQFLQNIENAASGAETAELEPITRQEKYLKEIADAIKNGGGGGGGGGVTPAQLQEEINERIEGDLALDDAKADWITDTSSGAVASFADSAGKNAVSVVATIEPVQDLHGQSNPYPAGGGKNKLNASDKTLSAPGYIIGNQSGGAPISLSAGTYTFSFDFTGTQSTSNYVRIKLLNGATEILNTTTPANDKVYVFTIDSSVDGIVLYAYNPTGGTWKNLQIESGSSRTAYAPYENICPISGWTGCNVNVTGINLFNMRNVPAVGTYTKTYNDDGSMTIVTTSGQAGAKIELTGAINAGTYTVKNHGDITFYVQSVSNDYTHAIASGQKYTFIYDGTSYLRILWVTQTENTTKTYKLMLETGTVATTYEPYTGTTTPISWQTEAGTVYGGTIDVTNGVISVTRIKSSKTVNVSSGWHSNTKTKNKSIANFFTANVRGLAAGNSNPMYKCNIAPYGYSTQDTVHWYINESSGTTLNMFIPIDATGDITIECVAELAEYLTYQLTPTEVALLQGQNNVWTDTGNTTVTYKADTKPYIDKKIAEEDSARNSMLAPTENGDTASQAYAQGKYFVKNGQFCKAKVAIASGATFTLGTNYEVTTIADELFSALNS